jgi:hypothetical protein
MKLIKKNFSKHECGSFQLTCLLHRSKIDVFHYEIKISSDLIENLNPKPFIMTDLIGKWTNTWAGGKEKLEIKSDFHYFINDQTDPSFKITGFTNNLNIIEFTKKPVGSKPTFENQLTLVDEDTLIGTETVNGREEHDIRYIRII